MKKYLISGAILIAGLGFGEQALAQDTKPSPSSSSTQNKLQFEEWSDGFDGDKLNEQKWERFTFEGGSGGKIEVKDGEVRIRSGNKTRAGIRSKNPFIGDKFVVEARTAKVGTAYPIPGEITSTLVFGWLTIIFDFS